MNDLSLLRPVALACAAAGLANQGTVHAQDFDQPERTGYYFRLGAVTRFNVKASITGTRPTLAPGVYDNGFVLPDTSGGASPLTWNWGYNSDDQIVGDQLVLTRLDNLPTIGRRDISPSNPAIGGELIAGYHFPDFELGRRTARFGFELGYGYSGFSQTMNSMARGTGTFTTARHGGLSAILPPVPPYAGTDEGPGPLINLNPVAGPVVISDTPGGTATTLLGNFDNSFHEFRFGPSLEIDLNPRFSVAMSAGYSSLYTDASFDYVETVTFSNPAFPAPVTSRASVAKGAWHPGFYAEVLLNYRFTDMIGVFIGGDFHFNNQFTFGNATHQVKMDLGSTFGAKAGLNVRF